LSGKGRAEDSKECDRVGGIVICVGGVGKGDRLSGVEVIDSLRLKMLDSCPKAARNPIISGIALFGRNLKSGVILWPLFTLSSSLATVLTTTVSKALL
jgi:hypothetical protein